MAVVEQSPKRATVRVLRWRRFRNDLLADALSVWGYQAECPCGWRGTVQGTMAAARRELREHLESAHEGNPTKGGNG